MFEEIEAYRAMLRACDQMDPEELREFQPFALGRALGIEWLEVQPARVVARMAVTAFHHQPFGMMHGGVSLLLAETVAGMGGFINCPVGQVALGVEINANHIRSVQAGLLHIVGEPLHCGRTTQVWQVRLWNEQEQLVCAARCTMANVALADLIDQAGSTDAPGG